MVASRGDSINVVGSIALPFVDRERTPRVVWPPPAALIYTPDRFMTRLDEAQEKLARALTKLEKASRERQSVTGAASAVINATALEGKLAEAQARYDRLQAEARGVSDRLDQTIARVRGLLSR